VCVQKPTVGEICVEEAPCVDGACTPMFSSTSGDISVCATKCTSSAAGTGQSTCGAGEGCVTPPAGAVELEPGDIACDPNGAGTECGVAVGFSCLELEGGFAKCGRVLAVCAAPQSFFDFRTSLPGDEDLCDLTSPTPTGPRLCGFTDPTPIARPAQQACMQLFDAVPDVGACVAVCDASAAPDGQGDTTCGAGHTCDVPLVPQLYYPQPGDVPCPGGDTSGCVVGFNACVDFGTGEVCARPARVCIEEQQ
jgi:hypothetical protein